MLQDSGCWAPRPPHLAGLIPVPSLSNVLWIQAVILNLQNQANARAAKAEGLQAIILQGHTDIDYVLLVATSL